MASRFSKIGSTFSKRSQERLRIGFWDSYGLIPISEPLDRFDAHLYVVGQSGQGKSKFLQHLLSQLTAANWGCGVGISGIYSHMNRTRKQKVSV